MVGYFFFFFHTVEVNVASQRFSRLSKHSSKYLRLCLEEEIQGLEQLRVGKLLTEKKEDRIIFFR